MMSHISTHILSHKYINFLKVRSLYAESKADARMNLVHNGKVFEAYCFSVSS